MFINIQISLAETTTTSFRRMLRIIATAMRHAMNKRLYFVLDLIVNLALPWAAYTLAKPHWGEMGALLASAAPPIVWSSVELWRVKRVDALSLIVIGGIVLSLVAMLLGGSPKLLLVRESLISGIIGVAFLGSLCLPKPLVFYLAVATLERQQTEAAEHLRQNWTKPQLRRLLRMMTLIWGLGLTGEALLRSWLAWHWSAERYLAIGPWISYGIFGALSGWTFWQQRRARARAVAA